MTLFRLHTFCVAAVFACTLPGASAQAPSDQPVLLHSNTQLVQISVVVHDRKGQPILDLKKEDFSLTEKGRPQSISVFSVDSTGKLPTVAPKLPPHIFTNRIDERSGIPSSVTVILLDSLNTKLQDQMYARKQLVKFLQQLQPDDRVAIYSLGRGLKILHDYTADSSALLARLGTYRGQNLPDVVSSEPGEMADADMFGPSQAEADFYMTERVVNTLKALEAIAEHLASLPGRKNLIWLSGGFPLQIGFDEIPSLTGPIKERRSFTQEMDHAIRALTNANVAMYPVDARGLMVADFMGAESRTLVKRNPLAPTVTNLDTMEELASRTGGRAAYNGNDLNVAIRRAMEDAKVTYTIGYYPTNEEADGKFREIKIKVDRPGVNVRYRKGYFAMRPVQQDAATRRDQINGAVWSPLEATALALNARVDVMDKPTPNTVYVAVQVDPASIRLVQIKDRWVGKLDLIFAQKDAEGRLLGSGITDTLDLNLTKDSYWKLLKGGLTYRKSFPREAKAVDLRLVVRDAGTGSVGSIKVPFSQVAN